jgi:hypothetical protein
MRPVCVPFARAPRAAIVFPCHTSGAALVRRSVFALRAQTADPALFEVVVACDGGDPDGVLRAAVEPDAHPFRVTMVDSPRPRGDLPHRNHTRNAGWRAARAPLCWMIDADFLLPPHAVEHHLAEHDAAVKRGLPAVFTPVLASAGREPAEWLDRSAAWASSGSAADYERLLADLPIEGEIFSGYEDRHRPGLPSSERLPDLLEGMPILWRGLLEALGGFDEWFVGWGAEKEAFVDLLKGLQRAGQIDVRLLTSVRAIHQPHPRSLEERTHPQARRQQTVRHRRVAGIRAGARWWLTLLDGVRPTLGPAVDAADPEGAAWAGAPSRDWAVMARTATIVDALLTAAKPRLAGLIGEVVVLGEAAAHLAERVTEVSGLAARAVTEAELATLPADSAVGVIAYGLLGRRDDAETAKLCAEIRRVGKKGSPVVVAEATRGAENGSARPRAAEDYVRMIVGLAAGVERRVDAEYMIFVGTVARGGE